MPKWKLPARPRFRKFLCGHDERDWFAAAVPETSGVATVSTAMEALKPQEVLAAQAGKGLKARHRNRRHNKAFIRQGEWSSESQAASMRHLAFLD